MVSLTALWLPILVSTVLVFAASSVLHMVLRYHRTDYDRLPGEDAVMEAMRKAGVGPGNYFVPRAESPAAAQEPETAKKFEQGPVGIFNVMPRGVPAMGKYLVQWLIWILVVGVFVAYLTSRTLGPDAEYLQVFRVAGTAAFLVHVAGQPVASIWAGRSWSATAKHAFDGVVYTLLTAGSFGWLWPS